MTQTTPRFVNESFQSSIPMLVGSFNRKVIVQGQHNEMHEEQYQYLIKYEYLIQYFTKLLGRVEANGRAGGGAPPHETICRNFCSLVGFFGI